MNLPPKILAGALIIGVISNPLYYRLDLRDAEESFSGWKDPVTNILPTQFDRGSIDRVLGIAPGISSEGGADGVPVAITDEAVLTRHFEFDGNTYRLSGLVVKGGFGSAMLTGDEVLPVRLESGHQMPSGETVESIGLNEIVIITADGARRVVDIY